MAVDELLATIHQHGPAWAERSGEADRNGSIAPETAKELRHLGAHRVLQPAVFGGLQDSIHSHMRIVAAVGEYCVASAWCLSVWSAHNWMIGLLPDEGQADVWSDPTMLSSASIVPKTPLAADGGDVLVQGRFPFASGCDHADWLGIGGLAQFEHDGVPNPTPVICLVPRAEVMIDHESWNVIGLAGTGSKDLVIDQPVQVPAHRVMHIPSAIARMAPGQAATDRVLYRTPFKVTAAIVLAAPAVGAAKAALRRFEERVDGRVLIARQVAPQSASGTPVAGGPPASSNQRSDPAAALRLAESAADTHAAELVLLDAARRLDQLAEVEEPPVLELTSIARDTAYGVRLAAQAVDRLYEASGGNALRAEEPMNRYWRDVHAARSHAVLTWDAAAMAFGTAAFGKAAPGAS